METPECDLLPGLGSSSQLVLRGCCGSGRKSSWGEHASAQESESCPAIHLAFEELEAIDVPFHWSLAPRIAEGRVQRGVVVTQPLSEANELHPTRLLTLLQPAVQPRRNAFS